jgi:NTE family protein
MSANSINPNTSKIATDSNSQPIERRSTALTEKVCYNAIDQPKTGLVLTGGGARAAYQVGVLKALSELVFKPHCGNPFPIITGTSAGAINATVFASYAQTPRVGIKSLERVWQSFTVDQVFRSDFTGIVKNAARWTKSLFVQDYHKTKQLSLLNNQPLVDLLSRVIHYGNLQKAIDNRCLDAICVTASGYTSGQSVSFFQSNQSIKAWKRHRRIGCRTQLERKHLLASAAIPLVFPAVKVNREFFGDGSVRFLSPLSPAIHLGAERILVVGVDPIRDHNTIRPKELFYPTTADIAGHVLDSVFIDSLDSDLERINRVNKTLDLIPEEVRKTQTNLRPIETLSISPSQDLSELSSKYFHTLPAMVKFFFKRIGIDSSEGSTVLSYLLFEGLYTQELIDLGYNDAMQKADVIKRFFSQ